MPMMTGGRFMAETLDGYGVTHVFFVPVIIQRAMLEMEKLGIKRILTHGEKAAAYMADGYARASHKPGICAAQNVGAANLAAGLQDPFLAGSPVLAITGRKPRISQHRNSYQEVDHLRPFSAVTKYSVPVDTAEQLPFLLRQALREATSGAPGPVHLDLEGTSGNVVMEGEADLEVIIEENFTRVPAYRPEPEAEMVRAAAQALSAAQRPVIVAGGGVTASGAQQEVVQLAEMMSIPVATSLNAKTAIPDGHPLSVGVCGSYSRTCANRLVSEADLVLYIGSHTGSQVTNEWTVPSLDTPVIQIDIDPSELGRSYPAKATLQGDARACLRRLMEVLEPLGPRTEWVNRAQELVAEWREGVSEVANSDGSPIRPERLCKELTDYLPSDAVLVSDTGHSGIWTGTMIDLKEQTQQYIRCAGSLGWGFPGALGAKCALPDRPVICFTGDGGFWYHMSELETALRYGINAVIVVNNNHSLNQEKRSNDRLYAGQPGNPEELWHMLDVDLAKLAQAIGCFGIRVDQPGQIQSALEQAIASGKPAVVDVVSDIEGIAPPAWRP
ncbi:MAG: thiamine pyrophosphate-binding protein [Dehalococcoidia bacterium]|nr:thiamine pyrophosphate-binding protein [Dehalococcoidia bacterium]MEE2925773.1 thiamine pyrophosphate-binding protein [Chloroflexota bacterium]